MSKRRGRGSHSRPATPPAAERSAGRLPKVAAGVALGVLVVALPTYLLLSGDAGEPTPGVSTPVESVPTEEPPRPTTARGLFVDTCGSCHTLAAAGTQANFGPPLDGAGLTRERVLTQIRVGSVSGQMPPMLLQGAEADQVAAYVARVARQR